MSELFFSVIVPTYNRSERLINAVKSILFQTYQNFEIIIVDDGGSDNTKESIISLNDNRIKYFWKNNEERSIARNFGIEKSRGQYICFLDSDDLWYEFHLAEAYKHIKENNPEVFHSSFEYVLENTCQKRPIVVKSVELSNLLEKNFLHLNAVSIRRDVLEKIRFLHSPKAIISEDYYFWLMLAAHHLFICSPVITTAVIEHEARSLNNVNPDKAAASLNLIMQTLDKEPIFQLPEYRDKYLKYKASRNLLLALYYSVSGHKMVALNYLKRCLQLNPGFLFSRRVLAVFKKLVISR